MTILFGLPQIILTALILLAWGVALNRMGEVKARDTYDMTDVFWGPLIVLTLLYWGGFYG